MIEVAPEELETAQIFNEFLDTLENAAAYETELEQMKSLHDDTKGLRIESSNFA